MSKPQEDPLNRPLWTSHAVLMFAHFALLVFIEVLISDAKEYETYQLIVPINGTPYAGRKMKFNAQATLSCVHVISLIASAISMFFFDWYIENIERTGITIVRWVEYAITAPMLIIATAVLSGVRDRAALVSIAALIFAVILCGPLMQYVPDASLQICAVAFVLLTVAFTQIWVSFSVYDAPGFVTAIIFTMSVMYYSFGFVPLYAMKYNKPIKFEEIAQNKLSLLSKAFPTIFLVYGYLSMDE
jgi:hypothetical protein